MMKRKVKIFDTGHDEEDEINKFLEQNNATPISVTFHNLHDNYSDGRICNQWVRTVLIYESEANDV